MITIVNLTPHPVTIIRRCPDPNGPPDAIIEHRTEYPACSPADLPRATEGPDAGDMCLTDSGSDGQGGYENTISLRSTGLVEFLGYTGVDGLPDPEPGERMFGFGTFRIVSIVTAIGALAAGRGIEDLLVPMGQVRDATGRVIGATNLAPAASLLAPMYRALVRPYHDSTIEALRERNAARAELGPGWEDRALERLRRKQADVAAALDAAGPDDIVIGGRGGGPVVL
jgi:hypothetical protein